MNGRSYGEREQQLLERFAQRRPLALTAVTASREVPWNNAQPNC
jgi:hypothetical protein